MTAAGHQFEEHTAEVQVRLWAPSLASLFEEGAMALAELFAGRPVSATLEPRESVSIEASDRDALLVEWLNELLYRTEMCGHLHNAIRIHQITNEGLSASIGGAEAPVSSVKAATLHGLRIAETSEGYSASVILDV